MPSTTFSRPISTQLSISETHLEREKLVTAAKKKRENSHGQAQAVSAISTASNGTSAGVLALVHARWFSKPTCLYVQMKLVFSAPTHDWQGGSFSCHGSRYFRWFPQRHQRQFDARRVFSHERRKASIHFGSGLQFPAKLVARLVHAWRQSLDHGSWGASMVIPEGTTHTCRTSRGQKPDTIDYFLVSTLIRPLIQKCEIVKSVSWSPHCGVELTLNTNFGSVVSRHLIGKISKRNRHNTNTLQGQNTQDTEAADPTLWNETRHNCVFGGKKPRCQDDQEDTQAARSQYARACGFLEEADELGHALETWSDATTQYKVKVGRMCQTLLSGKFATFSHEACVGQWVNTIRKASSKSVIPEHALYAARKIVIFIQRWRHTQQEGDGRLELRRAQVCCRRMLVDRLFSFES